MDRYEEDISSYRNKAGGGLEGIGNVESPERLAGRDDDRIEY